MTVFIAGFDESYEVVSEVVAWISETEKRRIPSLNCMYSNLQWSILLNYLLWCLWFSVFLCGVFGVFRDVSRCSLSCVVRKQSHTPLPLPQIKIHRRGGGNVKMLFFCVTRCSRSVS